MRERSVPEEIMPSLFGCVGMIIINWTFVENSLDAWVNASYSDFGGHNVESEIPRQFGRKVRFLRKCFRRLPELQPFAAEAVQFLDRAEALSLIRNGVAHGTLSDFDPVDEAFTFAKVDVSDDKRAHVFEDMRFLGSDLIAAANELLAMAATGQEFSMRLLDAAEAKKQ